MAMQRGCLAASGSSLNPHRRAFVPFIAFLFPLYLLLRHLSRAKIVAGDCRFPSPAILLWTFSLAPIEIFNIICYNTDKEFRRGAGMPES